VSDRKPPDSITAAILADPGRFQAPEPQRGAQQVSDSLAAAKDAAAALKAVLQGEPVQLGDEFTGQLKSPEHPLPDQAASMKPSASITADILANPQAYLTPEQRQDGPQMGNAMASAADIAKALKAMLTGQPVDIGNEQSGQLRPQDTPSLGRER
jgi:hypothetical protein